MQANTARCETQKNERREELRQRFVDARQTSLRLAAPLSAEDQVIQSMDDASPTKWHLAHVTWAFEAFILQPHVKDYREFDPAYAYLFNSYYESLGDRHPRPKRGLLSRPALDEVHAYRKHVDRAIITLIEDAEEAAWQSICPLLTLAIHHEQQHQELILTDIKHVLSQNPLKPAYTQERPSVSSAPPADLSWLDHGGGLMEIGHNGMALQNGSSGDLASDFVGDFAYDNESPRHQTFLHPFRMANRPVTCGEYLAFMKDGGYERPEFWLADGWAKAGQEGWKAPLYWEKAAAENSRGQDWRLMTLSGLRSVNLSEPVTHVSYYEAEAYARWAGKRLPTEGEWETAATHLALGENSPDNGNFLGEGGFHPRPADEGASAADTPCLQQMFGDVWEWTQSSYLPYPGFKPAEGSIGEYNGKFMCSQMVLKGGSCVSARGHVRPSYRNFFYPPDRWQFTGIRLAEDGF